MIDALLVTLAVAGLLIGATGTWSPCGFSMIETIGPTGHEGGMPTTFAAAATFAPFALLGGAITFVLLALAGAVLGGGAIAYVIAAIVAVVAAVAEARGTPIVPQVRRQLPVRWRSSMPMPVAAAGYGVLLGLGFTTFVLSYGVWALMGIVLAVGDPLAGLVAGLAFGMGRAVPIVVLAPIADRPSGERACEAMAMRPALYRGARAGDAVALLALAAALAGAAGAEAAGTSVKSASDPATAGRSLVYETRGGAARLRREDGTVVPLPGHDPGTGGPWVATLEGGAVKILDRSTLAEAGSIAARGADAVAVSDKWVAVRTRRRSRDRVEVVPLSASGVPQGALRTVAKAKRPAQLSRPALQHRALILVVAKTRKNLLLRYKLRPAGKPGRRVLVKTRDRALSAPSISGKKIAYVLTRRRAQELMLKGLGKGRGRRIYRRGKAPPTLWNTALTGRRVYITVLKRAGSSRIISVGR